VARGSNASHVLRFAALGFVLILTLGAGGSETSGSGSTGSNVGCGAVAYEGPPTESVPSLVAPPRSCKPEFTGEAGTVEKVFRALLDAYERKDVDAVLARYATIAATRDELLAFVNAYSVRLYRINAIVVHGDSATVDYEDAIVGRNLNSVVTTLLGQLDVWTKENGSWKFVSDVSSTPGIPKGMATVTVTLRDDAPSIVSRLPKTEFALLVKNIGAAKGLYILGIPAHLDVGAFIPKLDTIGAERQANVAVPFPKGIREMGATPDISANGLGTMVFSGRLPKGRYLLVTRGASEAATRPPPQVAVFTVN
jgi:hypothetical protein